MNKNSILTILLCAWMSLTPSFAQENEKNAHHQQAETEVKAGRKVNGRTQYIRAYEDYARQSDFSQAVACGVEAVRLYYKDNKYKEAFELLHTIDQTISRVKDSKTKAALRYQTVSERMQMYVKLKKTASALEQLNNMEKQARQSGDDALYDDYLYQKTILLYSMGQQTQGNAAFSEMTARLTSQKNYDKVEEVYKTLIRNGRRSGSANLVAQSYASYMAWKDSVVSQQRAEETAQLEQQIEQGQQAVAERDSQLSARKVLIVILSVVVVALLAVLALLGLLLVRLIALTRGLKKKLRVANETNAQKAEFIGHIADRLNPALQQMDGHQTAVMALRSFVADVQQLSSLETAAEKAVETEAIAVQPFCEQLMDEMRSQARLGVTMKLETPKISVPMHREHVTYILRYLLTNALDHTTSDGHIWLDVKKRGPRAYQFIVSYTGATIPVEEREALFVPFQQTGDLTEGTGLRLPICRQMALNMGGDLSLDTTFTKGVRFILDIHPNSSH